jgi:hypothetical protein
MFAACFQDIEAARFNVGFSLAPDPPLRRIIVLLRRDHNGPLLGFVSRVTYGASWVVLPALNLGNSATPAIARPVFTTPQLWLAIPFLNTLAEQKTNSLGTEGANADYAAHDVEVWKQPQRKSEGDCWAKARESRGGQECLRRPGQVPEGLSVKLVTGARTCAPWEEPTELFQSSSTGGKPREKEKASD